MATLVPPQPFMDADLAKRASDLAWRKNRRGLEPHFRQVVKRIRALNDDEATQLRAALDERDAESEPTGGAR